MSETSPMSTAHPFLLQRDVCWGPLGLHGLFCSGLLSGLVSAPVPTSWLHVPVSLDGLIMRGWLGPGWDVPPTSAIHPETLFQGLALRGAAKRPIPIPSPGRGYPKAGHPLGGLDGS